MTLSCMILNDICAHTHTHTHTTQLQSGEYRDKLSIDCERLELQVQQLKNTTSRLVEDHTKTLERVNELWKQKWPPAWNEVGHVTAM